MKLEKLKPGMIVYDVGKTKMGNTTMTSVAVWPVKIIDVDLERRRVTASWNGNTPRVYPESTAKKWRGKEPVLVREAMGRRRLATREEIKAMRDADVL